MAVDQPAAPEPEVEAQIPTEPTAAEVDAAKAAEAEKAAAEVAAAATAAAEAATAATEAAEEEAVAAVGSTPATDSAPSNVVDPTASWAVRTNTRKQRSPLQHHPPAMRHIQNLRLLSYSLLVTRYPMTQRATSTRLWHLMTRPAKFSWPCGEEQQERFGKFAEAEAARNDRIAAEAAEHERRVAEDQAGEDKHPRCGSIPVHYSQGPVEDDSIDMEDDPILERKHSTDVEAPPPPCVCVNVRTFTLRVSHALILDR